MTDFTWGMNPGSTAQAKAREKESQEVTVYQLSYHCDS